MSFDKNIQTIIEEEIKSKKYVYLQKTKVIISNISPDIHNSGLVIVKFHLDGISFTVGSKIELGIRTLQKIENIFNDNNFNFNINALSREMSKAVYDEYEYLRTSESFKNKLTQAYKYFYLK